MRLRRIIEPEYAGVFYRKEKYEHDPELREAYEEGCEHGYKKAMREMEADGYHERRGNVIHRGGDGSRILYREEPEWDDDDVEYRRYRRNRMGRFIP